MWIKIGQEHINLEAAASILEIENGYEIRHGRSQYTTVQAIEPKPLDPNLDGVAGVQAMQKFEFEQDEYDLNKVVIDQIDAFLLEREAVKVKKTRVKKA